MGFGAIAGAVGGQLLDAGLNMWSQHEARDSAKQMYKQRYQLMVQDLQKAGLNPMLAYMKDAGTPPVVGGGMISSGSGGAITQAETNSAQRALINQQEQKVNAEVENVKADTDNKRKLSDQIEAQTYQMRAQGLFTDAQMARLAAEMPYILQRARSEAEAAELLLPRLRNLSDAEMTEFKKTISPFLDDVQKIGNSANQFSNALSPTRIFDLLDKMRRTNKMPDRSGNRR